MKKLLYILLFPLAVNGQVVINLSPDSTLYDLHQLPPTAAVIDTTIFYVKNGGDDTKDGHSDANAWATLDKVNSTSFDPGDQILFKRNSVWRGTDTLSSSGTSGNYITYGAYGSGNSPKFLGSEKATGFVNISGNIWVSETGLVDPFTGIDGNVWFLKDGETTWGDSVVYAEDGDYSNFSEEYDWAWGGNDSLFVYALTDPDTRYDSVEVAQRNYAIYLNDKEYIIIDGINMFYVKHSNVRDEYPVVGHRGLIIRNCELAWNGTKDGEGHGIHVCYNNMLFEYNTVHDVGRRGISIVNYGDADIDTIMIQNNVFYNGFHTTGPDIESGVAIGEAGNLDSIIIRNNIIWDTEDRALAEGSAVSMWIQGPQNGTGVITGLYIYNNIIKFTSETGIGVEDVDEIFINNNTFYGHNNVLATASYHVNIGQATDTAIVQNNIFYTLLDYDSNGAGTEFNDPVSQDHTKINADYNLYYRINNSLRIIISNGVNYYMDEQADIIADLGWETNGVFSDALFSGEPDSLRITAISPAVGAGTDLAWYSTDIDGVAVSSPPNQGAYETVHIGDTVETFIAKQSSDGDSIDMADVLGFPQQPDSLVMVANYGADSIGRGGGVQIYSGSDTVASKGIFFYPATKDTFLTVELYQMYDNKWSVYPNTDTCLIDSNATTLYDGIIAYYNFDEASGDLLDQVGSSDGTVTGATQGVAGKIGDCYTFDGNDLVSFGAIDYGNTLTYAGWIKSDISDAERCIIGWSAASGPELRVIGAENLRFNRQSVATIGTSTGTITNETWTHVAITYNSTSGAYVFYIGGSPSGSGTNAQALTYSNEWIGRMSGGNFFLGEIDEFGIWNRVLTAGEITQLFNGGSGITYPF